ncbi:MAG: KH domain-containing protein [Verrucomicrobiae bacterium]|nr:KH domain-containing protein [Verrucomicrobiae bacterium]
MKDFVEYAVRALVDFSDEVRIEEIVGEKGTTFRVKVHPTDAGKVIGRQGRTIQSLRGLLYGAASRQGKRVVLELLEPSAAALSQGDGETPR